MFNNWALIGCDSPNDRVPCVLLRRAVNQQTRRLVMQMTVARAPNGSTVMAVTLPPNVVIPAGVTITPMGGTAVKGPIPRLPPAGLHGGYRGERRCSRRRWAARTPPLVGIHGRHGSPFG
jgi:hypothetical protein